MKKLRIPIRVGGTIKEAEILWAKPPALAECAMLKSWGTDTPSVSQLSSAELAHLTALKWEFIAEWGTLVSSYPKLASAIRKNPKEEVTAMLLVVADWFKPSPLGSCLFHRTWANNIYLDFLAAHPATMDSHAPIRSVGTGLLYALCEISLRLKAPILWGETTAASVSFYREIFDLPDINDLLSVTTAAQRLFLEDTRRKWTSIKRPS